jgi:hypothetical protein
LLPDQQVLEENEELEQKEEPGPAEPLHSLGAGRGPVHEEERVKLCCNLL